jgi:hypothetical protein
MEPRWPVRGNGMNTICSLKWNKCTSLCTCMRRMLNSSGLRNAVIWRFGSFLVWYHLISIQIWAHTSTPGTEVACAREAMLTPSKENDYGDLDLFSSGIILNLYRYGHTHQHWRVFSVLLGSVVKRIILHMLVLFISYLPFLFSDYLFSSSSLPM